jgi:uncharacterized membrane protein
MFLSISRCLMEQVKLQRRKGNWDNEYCIEFPCLMKSTREHYGLLQTRLFHSARWSGWLSAPQCSTIMVKFYEKLWLLKKKNNKLLTSQIVLTDCTKKGLASLFSFWNITVLWSNTTQIVITHICVIFSRRTMSLSICSMVQLYIGVQYSREWKYSTNWRK